MNEFICQRKHFIILLFFGLCLILSNCKDETTSNSEYYKSIGTITGPDLRECACCGGWFIDIQDSTYRFYDLPESSDIDLAKDTFPLMVRLDWNKSPTPCMGDEIIILRIKVFVPTFSINHNKQ